MAEDRIKINGIPGFQGEYEVDQGAFNMGDLRLIKRVAGVRAGELDEALKAGDVDVLIAIAIIALKKSGHPHWEAFDKAIDDAPLDPPPISYIGGEDDEEANEAAANPPAPQPVD